MLTVLLEGVVSVPKSGWQGIAVDIERHGTIVECSFSVPQHASRVQASLVTRADAERFDRGRSYRPLYSRGFQKSGRFHYQVQDAGPYVLLLDNRIEGRSRTEVSIKIDLLHPSAVAVTTVPPERRRTIVALSLLFFGAVVVYTASRFLKNI
ncbi:MAG: hypothetical protein ACRD7E_17190 [Bryobacteraceae bacterium]